MTEDQCLKIAEDYLSSHSIEHVRPGQIGSKKQGRWEAIFLNQAGLNPAVAVVDPSDVRMGHGPERTGGMDTPDVKVCFGSGAVLRDSPRFFGLGDLIC